MTLGVTLSLILWIVTVLGFLIWNLYQKNKKMEELIELQQYYINAISSMAPELEATINKIDSTMWVQSDPELIQLFDTIKSIHSVIKRIGNANGN